VVEEVQLTTWVSHPLLPHQRRESSPSAMVWQFTIKNSSSGLERRINRWAADTLAAHLRSAPPPPPGTDPSAFQHLALVPLAEALFQDVDNVAASPFLVGLSQMGFDYPGLGIVVQSLLRHVMSQLLCEGIVNRLLVTNSEEANQ